MMIRFNFLHFISEWIDHKDYVIIIAPLEKNLFVYPTLFLAATTKLGCYLRFTCMAHIY